MKKLCYILLIAIAFLVSNCDTNDDGFYNNVFVDVPSLVTIEPHSSAYTVGEKLYIEADDLKRNLSDGAILDIFQTTGATQFAFSYVIEKQINATTRLVLNINSLVSGLDSLGYYTFTVN